MTTDTKQQIDSALPSSAAPLRVSHTPGPWTVTEGRDEDHYSFHRVCAEANCFPLAELQGYSGHEREANAKLIAAAPCLLAALKDAEDALMRCEFVGAKAMDGGIGAIDSALINIRAAIAKAQAQ